VVVNTFHWDYGQAPLSPESTGKFQARYSQFFSAIQVNLTTNLKGDEMRHYAIPTLPGPIGEPVEIVTLSSFSGTGGAAQELPPQDSFTITWQTGKRRHWGRIYLPGVLNDGLTEGRITPGVVDSIGDAARLFFEGLLTDGITLVTFDRKLWNANDVVGVSMDDIVDVQRRRRFDKPFHRYSSI
jgi:hypothetical protein